jgi:hypothetical protein
MGRSWAGFSRPEKPEFFSARPEPGPARRSSSREPLEHSLYLKTHLPLRMRTPGGRSTNVQVRLRWSASNSACMASIHLASRSAAHAELGSGGSADCTGDAVDARAYLGFGQRMPTLA